MSSKIFLQVLWRSSRPYKIGHDLGPFSTSQKIVLSSSRRQGIFEVQIKFRENLPNSQKFRGPTQSGRSQSVSVSSHTKLTHKV